jgi:8-oxo-dGTP pyrophosphatase MutT (NUDIX family)
MGTKARRSSKAKKHQDHAVRVQYGALPYRETKAAGLEILLVTTRQSRRWIIPKGWPIKGLSGRGSAAREAYEEAGVRGTVGRKSIGTYIYSKLLDDIAVEVACEVHVYALRVRRREKAWPESRQREVRWYQPREAVAAIEESGLKSLVETFVKASRKKASRK